MFNSRYTALLFLVIIIEGYIVLSTELLAIRQSIPFVGSGTDTVSIIIAAVLMPLAFGYQAGGNFKPFKLFGKLITVRRKLILNITLSALILLPGMSYIFLVDFFDFLNRIDITNRLGQTAVYSILFLVIPVYLLGQTVPLTSNFFGKQRLSKITGKILFFSTVGSFLGAILSTLVLMPSIGVNHTVTLNFVLMAILVIMLSKKQTSIPVIITILLAFGVIAGAGLQETTSIILALIFAAIVLISVFLTRKKNSLPVFLMVVLALTAIGYNSNALMRSKYRMVKLNEYHNISIIPVRNGDMHLMLNNNYSSRYNRETGGKHNYIDFAERVAISPIINSAVPKDILVIGAGGFTFGHNDKNNNYIYIDIDKDLKHVSEKYILGEPIGDNKRFEVKPARAFLSTTDMKFDVIYLDAYLSGVSVPEHLITKEFFEQIKSKMKDRGVLVTNFITAPNFNNIFSRNLDNTIRSVFPHVSRQSILESYLEWDDDPAAMANIAYIYKHFDDYDVGHIYTDDQNTVFIDTPKSKYAPKK